MAYFEFKYLPAAHRPVVADMFANAESDGEKINIGKIVEVGDEYRAIFFLPGANSTNYAREEDAAVEMLAEAHRWLARAGLKISGATNA